MSQDQLILNKKLLNPGQVLVEVLVAIGIFVSIMVSIISMVSLSKQLSALTIQKMQATSYVQEGIEKIRNIRDENMKAPRGYQANIDNGTVVLRDRDLENGFQATINTLPETIPGTSYRRTINITPGTDYFTVDVTVSWEYNGTKSVSAKEILSNWEN